MSLVVNGRFLTRPMTGVDRVAFNVVKLLDRIWPAQTHGRFKVAVPPGERTSIELQNADIVSCGKLRGNAWEQLELPRHHTRSLILNLCNTAPLVHPRNFVVIHDVNVFEFPESYSLGFRTWYKFLLPRIAQRAACVATVSNHSAQRLMAHRITREPAAVIHNGCDHFSADRRDLPRKRNMVLFAGSPAPHKNLELFIRLASRFELQGIEFVVAGAASASVFSKPASQPSLPANLRFLGRVDEAELVKTYREASVLLFPSFVEGFGLTPLEAQIFGCPVVSSDRQPMLELLGSSALFADPLNLDGWEAAVNRVLTQPTLAQSLSDAGRMNSARYTWAAAAEAYLELVLPLLAQRPAQSASTLATVVEQRA